MMLFLATYFGVFLLGFQQQNVTGGHYYIAAVTSMTIAGTQFLIYNGAVGGGWVEIAQMALGGSMGITSSMYAHKRWIRREDE